MLVNRSFLLPLVAAPLLACAPSQEESSGMGGAVTRFDAPYHDPGDGMATSLAEAEDISLAEARRRLAMQHEAGVLAHRLRATYGERFAGLAILQETRSQVDFYFVGLDLADVREALPTLGASAELLSAIWLHQAAKTEAEMQATATRMTGQLHDLGIDGSVAQSVSAGGYRIITPDPNRAAEAVRNEQVQGGPITGIEEASGITF